MIKRAPVRGIRANYMLFDSWYAWPTLINTIPTIKRASHVICRLKDSKTHYGYKRKNYRLSQLYQRMKGQFKISKVTGQLTCRAAATVTGSNKDSVILFVKAYSEPQAEPVKGQKSNLNPNERPFYFIN